MEKGMFLLAEKIKMLREKAGLTQAELARKMNLTRSSINGWEMGLSIPSTNTIVELSKIFHVTTDYLLGLDNGFTIRGDDLTEKEIVAILHLLDCFQENKKKE